MRDLAGDARLHHAHQPDPSICLSTCLSTCVTTALSRGSAGAPHAFHQEAGPANWGKGSREPRSLVPRGQRQACSCTTPAHKGMSQMCLRQDPGNGGRGLGKHTRACGRISSPELYVTFSPEPPGLGLRGAHRVPREGPPGPATPQPSFPADAHPDLASP